MFPLLQKDAAQRGGEMLGGGVPSPNLLDAVLVLPHHRDAQQQPPGDQHRHDREHGDLGEPARERRDPEP